MGPDNFCHPLLPTLPRAEAVVSDWYVTSMRCSEGRSARPVSAVSCIVSYSVSTDNISDLVKYYQCHNPVNTVTRPRSDSRDQSATHTQYFYTHIDFKISQGKGHWIHSFFVFWYLFIELLIAWILSFGFLPPPCHFSPLYVGVCHSAPSAPLMTPKPWVSGEDLWRKLAAVEWGVQVLLGPECDHTWGCLLSRNIPGPGDSDTIVQHTVHTAARSLM